MSESNPRYIFSGHAIGAAAQFHKLDDVQNLNHIVPTLGASVLPGTGGLSKSHVDNYCFSVEKPRPRDLLSVRRIDSQAIGIERAGRFETEVQTEIEAISVVDKLHIDRVKLHLLSVRDPRQEAPVVQTQGNVIEGMRLGHVKVKILFDEEPLGACGSQEQLAAFYKKQNARYRQENAWRFNTDPASAEIKNCNGHYKCSLVRQIQLVGEDKDITVQGDTITWVGFGKIILGEVIVKPCSRRLTMVRLAMGSNAGGPATVGDGESNGMVSN